VDRADVSPVEDVLGEPMLAREWALGVFRAEICDMLTTVSTPAARAATAMMVVASTSNSPCGGYTK
jgi:hypothetical protein